jgi:gluconolactonase
VHCALPGTLSPVTAAALRDARHTLITSTPPNQRIGGITMAVKADTPDMFDLVDTDAEVERLATGFTFTEGPVWNKESRFLLFSDMPADVRRRWDETNGVEEVMKPSNKCNGMTYEADGSLLVCEHVTSSLVRERPDGTRETVASHYEGKELNSPNDVIVADDGSILFTDPSYGRMPVYGLEREQVLDLQGVYLIPPGNGKLKLLIDDFEQPNGLAFSPDESLLYINDTPRAHIRVFDWQGDSLANGRMFADNIGSGVIEEGVPDGMKCDERGNVYVTGPGGVWVFNPDGKCLGVIQVPENVGNLNWGGDNWNELYMPSSTSLYRIKMNVSGNRLSYMR